MTKEEMMHTFSNAGKTMNSLELNDVSADTAFK
jgi:hypothetical protein